MNHPHESALQYPLGENLPAASQCLEIAPGIKWIRMSLPFALDHINLWLLRDRQEDMYGQMVDGWSVIDCCVNRTEARSQWEQIFANELEGLPVLRVIVTHMHPDHIGRLAVRTLESPTLDQCHRLQHGPCRHEGS